jgi:hypothetical protein
MQRFLAWCHADITKTVVGMISTIGGAVLPFIEFVTPYMQFTGMCLGLTIGVLTVREKIGKKKDAKQGN